jgi:ACS family hexuronate transporter-like MFS transporter
MDRRLRWGLLALVFLATTLNYLDRQIIALLKPMLQVDLHWSDIDYGRVVGAFQVASALSLLAGGWFVDRVGLHRGYSAAVGIWSLAAAAHAAARTVLQFGAARFVLGAAEAVNTPASVKAVAAWFPDADRSVAVGVNNAAPNVGAIATPLVVPALALALGWRGAFLVTGLVGLIWLALWLPARRLVEAGTGDHGGGEPTDWRAILTDRRTWTIAGAKLITDQVWWFMLFWAPDFLHRRYHLGMDQIGPPLALIYAMAAAGAFGGGWLAARLLKAGWRLDRARKTPLLIAAVCVLPAPLVLWVDDPWVAAGLVGLVLACHQTVSTNIFAMSVDLFPMRRVGVVVGLGSTCGTLSGLALTEYAAVTLAHGGSYLPMFLVCAGAYSAALVWVQLMAPNLDRLRATAAV